MSEKLSQIFRVKVAYLTKVDDWSSNFNFDFNDKKYFYAHVKFVENPEFAKAINENSNLTNSFYNDRLNIDYNKYLVTLNITSTNSMEADVIHQIILNRETSVISHTTPKNVKYLSENKKKIH